MLINEKTISNIKKKSNIIEEPHDDYHTMNELYDHRTVLFAIICKFSDKSWKSKKHSDGTSEDGWFIAGIETPYGQITYHQKEEYWELFQCKELYTAPEYDGHTPDDVLERLKKTYFGKFLE